MGTPYEQQLREKNAACRHLLAGFDTIDWMPPVPSAETGFRNKAKMVVGGTVEAPTLGILDDAGAGIDLSACGVIAPRILGVFDELKLFIARARLTPYDVPSRRGELKYVLLTESRDGELMLRFVLRSQEPVARIRKHLPALRAALPRLAVASVNLQPEHKAVLEGEREIVLTERDTLEMRVNDVALHLRAKSFFQTNTPVAEALYRQARDWCAEIAPSSVWDLYCGVGGFALHCAAGERRVTGVEVSAEAIESATLSARRAGLSNTRFIADDATAFALRSRRHPELVIVNPPRRGIGADLAGWLERSQVQSVIYSSCNAVTLAKDLAAMPSLVPTRARVLDMFPQTKHSETIVLLERSFAQDLV